MKRQELMTDAPDRVMLRMTPEEAAQLSRLLEEIADSVKTSANFTDEDVEFLREVAETL